MSDGLSLNKSGRLSLFNAARRLRVPCRSLRHWAATGQIPATRDGCRLWTFLEDDVEALRPRVVFRGMRHRLLTNQLAHHSSRPSGPGETPCQG